VAGAKAEVEATRARRAIALENYRSKKEKGERGLILLLGSQDKDGAIGKMIIADQPEGAFSRYAYAFT
jgi:hypothetical protein